MNSTHRPGRIKDFLQEQRERQLAELRVKRFAPVAMTALLRGVYKRRDRLKKEREQVGVKIETLNITNPET